MNTCLSCSGVGFILLGTQYVGVDHATLAPVYCDTLERCEAMRIEAEREDFEEACAGLDRWYRAQGAAA